MILCIGGTKGGPGKTTLATNFAVMASGAGSDVLLVDADQQGHSAAFTALREQKREEGAGYTCIQLEGINVRHEVKRMQDKFDDIIIDAGGRDNPGLRAAITISDRLLVPICPSTFDLWSAVDVKHVIDEVGVTNPNLQIFTCISKGYTNGKENIAAAEDIKEKYPAYTFLDPPIQQRKVYSKVVPFGLAVVETKRPVYKPDPKACDELNTILTALMPHLYRQDTVKLTVNS